MGSTTQNLDFDFLIKYIIEEILEPASFRLWQMTSPTSTRRFARPGPERRSFARRNLSFA